MYAVIGMHWTDECPSQLHQLILHGDLRVSPDEVVLMHYSCLKDKSGVFIYEGHILKHQSGQGAVTYQDGSFQISGTALTLINDREVIGNIYEQA
ncbi:MAG: hypothetical protein CEO22_582 [Candidatus Berkelbacteria bacterium Gr01-1014_85]|uniref:YopX protein domain-containing protein n=1 Tax=Candidatus Berkelbacteria bacterium Gr01-1014_85 TaxID=2017150 RepID=A0A554J9X8_9BACT|nr:MAG: hypothetical protein CEO22_582 [Candidatus Berkelbacteria bacterium Gr01-1014_85]